MTKINGYPIKPGANLEGANLNKANLSNIDLREANLHNADLRNADLSNTNLSMANLRNANLSNTNLSMANLSMADLRNANLRKADLNNADLRNADLNNANLIGANIDYSCLPLWCGGQGAKIDNKQAAQLLLHALAFVVDPDDVPEYAIIRNAARSLCFSSKRRDQIDWPEPKKNVNLVKAPSNIDLSNIDPNADLRNACLIGVNLSGTDLSNTNLSNADLRNANLSKANLRNAVLSYADLSSANLRGAHLRSADLSNAGLSWADLRGADLSSANLRGTHLRNVDLREADLHNADLRNADLRNADLSGANIDFSCLPLWRGGQGAKIDRQQAAQLLLHALSFVVDPDDVPEYATIRNAADALCSIFKWRDQIDWPEPSIQTGRQSNDEKKKSTERIEYEASAAKVMDAYCEALTGMSAASDFSDGGKAAAGWKNIRKRFVDHVECEHDE